ncbi:Transcriptional regulatory protein ZraR [Gemmata sp. SH-PL17]|uniref:ATP-binding response regulator n=1 Tax=Gemmata sp. SH-PL17 TaxID=1630693 RepID=UPI00078CFFF5|nr:response regulator [Gemmata sp. SH-PL17]AMV23668.1 Transcriptional regulatory protein ZraR [Gemmata sp. SH-PL17]
MPAQVSAPVDTPPASPSAPQSIAQVPPTILLVDDSSVQRRIVHTLLDAAGSWQIAHANDGVAALQHIEKDQPDLVLTDVYMPKMDGLALVEQVRDRFPSVPVVLMTGHGSEQVAVNALKAGAADYVPKRAMVTDLGRILERVLANAQSASDRTRLLSGMTGRTSRFVLENDPRLVGPLVAQLREELLALDVCNRHSATRVGIALEEALLNAIYHGNLEIGGELKNSGGEAFQALVKARRHQPPFIDRRVRVLARVTSAKATFVITDEGKGFEVPSTPDTIDPALLDRPNGRGLLLMRSFMTDVRYNTTGNRVTLTKTRSSAESRNTAIAS